jgi:hypothetical protein
MPFVLLILGAVLFISAIRNTQGNLFTLLGGDFTGSNNFIFWVVSILAIGALGYIPKLKPLSAAFLALVIIVLFLTKGVGFFSQLTAGIGSTTSATPGGSGVATSALGSLGSLLSGGSSGVNPVTSLNAYGSDVNPVTSLDAYGSDVNPVTSLGDTGFATQLSNQFPAGTFPTAASAPTA